MRVNIIKLENLGDLPLPAYATVQSAGMDLMAALQERDVIIIKPMQRVLIKTGIVIVLPEGYEAQVRPRSGLAIKHGITVLNAPGTIDADYRGEISVILINQGQQEFIVTRGMRIAQLIISKYEKIAWNVVTEMSTTSRGTAGFGSTGQ
jgi:dUTP pyrophosphatase